MNYLKTTGKIALLCCTLLMLIVSACNNDADTTPNSESESAYLYTGRYSTPDGRKFFMGAFPSIPDSDPDISKLTELNGTSVATYTANGFVYSWDGEASEITKWAVEADLSFTKLDVLSFQTTGISGNNFGIVFISETEAYIPGFEQNVMVKWDPTTMTITETTSFTAPNTGFEYYNFTSFVSGNNIYIPLSLADWDELTAETKAIVAVFNTQTKTMTYAEDTRVQANEYAFQDEQNNLYSVPSKWPRFLEIYGPEKDYPAQGGLVRILNGDNEFDPDFYVNLAEISGAEAILGVFYVGNNKLLVKQYSDVNEFPAPEDLWDFSIKKLDFKLVDFVAGTAVDFPGLTEGYAGNNNIFEVEGKFYHQTPNRETGNTSIGIISENGWQQVFEISGGDLNILAKIR